MILKKLNSLGFNIIEMAPLASLPLNLRKEIQGEIRGEVQGDLNIYLIGNGGPKLWENLPDPLEKGEHPIDHFSKDLILEHFPDALILYPYTKLNPLLDIPLQKLSRFFNLSHPSPLGIDISKDYGLWFSFRVAFLSASHQDIESRTSFESPCLKCVTNECVSSCPAKAVSLKNHFHLKACGDYRDLLNSECSHLCLARLSCPFKENEKYYLAQIKYHSSITKRENRE